jgi:predicted XRE-type DNA-binding protein
MGFLMVFDCFIKSVLRVQLKRQLFLQFNRLIEDRRLKQIEAAKLLGIYQTKTPVLIHGRLSEFSIERLFKFLRILNQDVVIVIKPHGKKAKNSIAHIFVQYAEASNKATKRIGFEYLN